MHRLRESRGSQMGTRRSRGYMCTLQTYDGRGRLEIEERFGSLGGDRIADGVI